MILDIDEIAVDDLKDTGTMFDKQDPVSYFVAY